MPNSRNLFLWALIASAPTLFIFLLAVVFNDFTPAIAIIVLLGLVVSGGLFYRGGQLKREEAAHDNPSRRRRRSGSPAAKH